ncbi:hypothetical protein FQR65_LT05685 [Abscondita terminalis]|nr:hypothetical protein FQR65_LT05685 [Abscondita terminalis]
MTSKLDKFILLMWKNFLLQWRHPIQTALEIIVPIIFTIILVVLRSLVHPDEYPASFFLPFDTKVSLTANQVLNKTVITWSPTNPELKMIMDDTVDGINLLLQTNFTHTSVDSYDKLESVLSSDIYRFTTFAGVSFSDDYLKNRTIQKQLSVVLRFPGELNWETDKIFPIYYVPGIKDGALNEGGPPNYYREGFLLLQEHLSHSIIRYHKKIANNSDYDRASVPIRLQRLPYPKYTSDFLLSSLDIFIGTVFMLSFVYTCINIVKIITTEKELQLKETMKIMGLPNWLHWTAWFFKSFITILISIIIMTILLTVKWYPNSEYTIFTNSNPLVIFLILILFTTSTITFSFAVSTFASKANTAATIAGIGWFLLFCPFMTLQYNYDEVSRPLKMFISIFSNSAIGFAFRLTVKHENTGYGLHWDNIWSSIQGENIVVGEILIMLVFDTVFYFLIAIYMEAVFPGQYGVGKPWYFLFKIFDFRRKPAEAYNDILMEPVNSSYHEKEPTHLESGIQIKNLKKKYGTKEVLHKLSLNMYRDQITVLLGHNGAGKSTTISILTGMITPSSGTAIVGGHDIRNNIDQVRNSLGICPQHNILFDELTVEEHLYFYSKLKGISKKNVKDEIDKYLRLLELTQKAKTPSSKLSGGMKRKLSVGIAFCGNSKVVLCDEPTAGMDPSARRALWDLLLSQKKDRTILLTTHFMDEADLLGDRIAIMANGRLQCSGSSFFLKKKYGAGYHLILDKSAECEVNKVTELFRKYISNINVHSNIGSELTYVLSEEYLSIFEQMLNELELNSATLGVRSYGISLTTLQEVFIKVGSGRDESDENDFSNPDDHINGNLVGIENGKAVNGDVYVQGSASLLTSWALWRNQILAMFMKRILAIRRSWLILLIQTCIPVLYLLLTLFVPVADIGGFFPRVFFTLSRYVEPTTLIVNEINNSYYLNYKDMLGAMNKTYLNSVNGNMTILALSEAEKDLSIYNTRYITGATFHANNSITAWFSNQPYHGTPLALQLVLNCILHTEVSPEYNIFMYNHPLPYTVDTKFTKMLESNTMGYQISFNLGFSMAFVSSFYVMFYIQERASKFKHLQFVSGIDVLSFWIPSFICDMVTAIMIGLVMIITLVTFQEVGFMTFAELGRLFFLYLAFMFGNLPLMYLGSFWHTVPSSGYVRMSLLNILIGIGGFIIVDIFNTEGLDLEHVGKILQWIFLIMPHYCFNAGVRTMNVLSNTIKLCENALETCNDFNISTILNNDTIYDISSSIQDELCKMGYCDEDVNFFSLKATGVGRNLLYSFVTGICLFAILLSIEYNVFSNFRCIFRKYQFLSNNEPEDEDVIQEKSAITYDVNGGNQKQYNLILYKVRKNYKELLAVNDVTLGINRKECFGLLGVNGAGKTTTFRIITGDLKMSSGDVWVNGWNIRTNLKEVYRLIGYCPQFDALLDDLTCAETLKIFALLRGVLKTDCNKLIEKLAREFDFYQHLQKKVKELSGGNKRKLSTALALVGDPLVLYLDEPTAGVDPATKRYLWNALCKVRDHGTTIVLTSHSMEECEALCTRLAIMVNGSFKCIGSTQHLKSKFSDGYTLMIKTRAFNTDQEQELSLNQIEHYVRQNFQNVQVREKHQEMITFYITSRTLVWSRMFGVIEKGKTFLPIEDYSLGQSSLEQVFLTFTKQQREEEANP